jgi:hypothetical protein
MDSAVAELRGLKGKIAGIVDLSIETTLQQSGAFWQAQALWHEQNFYQLKYALHQECEQRCRNGSLHNQPNIVKSDTGEYRLSVAAGSYQSA